MFNGRIGELLIILLIVFVIFGSNRLTSAIPEIAKSLRTFFDILGGKKNPKNPSNDDLE